MFVMVTSWEGCWVIQKAPGRKKTSYRGGVGAIIYLSQWQTHTCLKSHRESTGGLQALCVRKMWHSKDHQHVLHESF